MLRLLKGFGALLCLSFVVADGSADPRLTGTWTTKSNRTFTGPGFYDPVKERFIEPELTGISYSFSDDGFYEEAYYRAISNPTTPSCPKGMIQWQHGTFEKSSAGSLKLRPFGEDGRQLMSDPCYAKTSFLTRYNQPETFQRYDVYMDPYHGIKRLDLYKFDGSPMHPMYLAYKPPTMLPTQTLHPSSTASNPATATNHSRLKKRDTTNTIAGAGKYFPSPTDSRWGNPDTWWSIGLAMTSFGSILYFYF